MIMLSKPNEQNEITATVNSKKFDKQSLEVLFNYVTNIQDVINIEFKNWKFYKMSQLRLETNKPRSFYKISFISWDISDDSIINIVNSLKNPSQIDLSENKFTVEEAQLICDELNYLSLICMSKNKNDLSAVQSSNLVI